MATVTGTKVTYNLTIAPTLRGDAPQKVLMVAQQVTDTSTPGSLITDIGTSGEENALFGTRSQLATMIREFRKLNVVTQIDAIPLNDDGGSTQATAQISLSGTATANGTYTFYLQSSILHKFNVGVTNGDTAATIAANIADAINNDQTILITPVATLGDVDLTFVHGGTSGNFIAAKFEDGVAGITTTWTAFAGGATDPDISNVFDVIGSNRYQWIPTPDGYDKATLAAFLDARFNVDDNVEDGRAIQSNTADQATQKASVATLNSQNFVNFANVPVSQPFFSGGVMSEYNPVAAVQFVAYAALRLTPNQNISSLLVGSAGSGNNFGGRWTAPVPYHETPFPNLPLVDSTLWWSKAQQADLNDNGISFFGNNSANNGVIVSDVVTTYLNDGTLPDTTWKYLNNVITASVIREFYVNNNRAQYAQAVLTSGDIVPNVKQVNIASFNAFQETLYRALGEDDGLVPTGTQALNFYKENINSSADFSAGAINTIQVMPINEGLREINGTLQIAFSTTSLA